jgi:hypothetical protein
MRSIDDIRDRRAMEQEIVVAWAGWPIPEMIGGAIVGSLLLLTLTAVPPQLRGLVPDQLSVIAGAILGAVLSFIARPRKIELVARDMTPEEEHLTRAA